VFHLLFYFLFFSQVPLLSSQFQLPSHHRGTGILTQHIIIKILWNWNNVHKQQTRWIPCNTSLLNNYNSTIIYLSTNFTCIMQECKNNSFPKSSIRCLDLISLKPIIYKTNKIHNTFLWVMSLPNIKHNCPLLFLLLIPSMYLVMPQQNWISNSVLQNATSIK
jgi:hypothetical protein